jgi:hypothetical protein
MGGGAGQQRDGAPIVAGALLVLFELLLIYRLLSATRSYTRKLRAA